MQNKPYVKQYENGILTNPIIDRYNSGNSLRKIKRNKERFVNIESIGIVLHQLKTKRGKWNTVKRILTKQTPVAN